MGLRYIHGGDKNGLLERIKDALERIESFRRTR
jgi:hypothetical protein